MRPVVIPGMDRWLAWDAGARQRASAYWRKHLESDPMLERAYVCVELLMGGKVISVARDTISTTRGSTGERINFLPALSEEPEIVQEISLGNQSPEARSISIEIPGWVLDPDTAIRHGYMLAGPGEVSLQLDGGDYDLRWVILRGYVSNHLAFGEPNEMISVVISDPRVLQSRRVPERVIDDTTWPGAQEAVVGERIPRVYNAGIAIPAKRVLDDHGGSGLLFAVCDTPDKLTVDTVFINGDPVDGGDADYPWSESTKPDGRGRRTMVIDFSASAPTDGWEDRDAVNVTLTRRDGVPAMGVLDIARELLGAYTNLGPLGLNLDLFSYAQTRIGGTAPSVVINASGQDTPGALQFVEGGLLPSYPMVHMLYAGAGLGAVVIDRRVGAGGAGLTGEMTGGQFPLFERASLYTESRDLYTDFEVRYRYNPMDRGYSRIVTRDPSNDTRCATAETAMQGRRPYPVIESPYITSDAEAVYVIEWLVAHHTLRHYAVEWSCSPWVHLRYRVGENVRYTDPEFGAFTECVATIVRLGFRRGEHTIALMVWPPETPRREATVTPAPPDDVPWDDVDSGYGDIETGGVGSAGTVETGGV